VSPTTYATATVTRIPSEKIINKASFVKVTGVTGQSHDISFAVDGTTNAGKERPIKRHKSLNPTISATTTMANDSSSAATSAGTSNTTTTGASTTSGHNNKTGTKASTGPPCTTGGASSRTDVGGDGRKSKRWAVEEEKKLASAVDTFGTTSWAKIAANVPGRSEIQCYNKWKNISSKAASTVSGTWTVEEEKKLASAVDTFGSPNWANIAVNVTGRNEKQSCYFKWQCLSRKASSAVSGTWTVEEETKLASAVETFGTTSWAKIAANVPGRSEIQCIKKWKNISSKAASTVSGTWTVEEEKKLASAVETFGATSWANIAANVPGRNENQCSQKYLNMSKKAAATSSGAWMVEEEKKLASAVETFGATSWANIAAKVRGETRSNVTSSGSVYRGRLQLPLLVLGR
jgi:hypothetical protein